METNIVEVENFVQQSEERRGSAFTQEVKRYLERYPNTQYVDVLLTDLNGCFRGKRIPVSSLKKLEKGCYFPASVFAMDILGNVVEEAGLGQEMGEPDRTCVPVLGSLTPSAADPEFIGQMLLTMVDEDGAPFDVEPRNVLNRLWQQLRQRGLFPVVAVELEFYLLDRQRDAECSNFWVNSLHGQGAKVVSPRLRVEARSPDGLVEAVSVINHPFALGVQWHPEWNSSEYALSRILFEGFITACQHHIAEKKRL
jgi:glutamine synthetase